MAKISRSTSGASTSKKVPGKIMRGRVQAKSGCHTCIIRRTKCDGQPDEHGRCANCVRLRLECLGFGSKKRPEWMGESDVVTEVREKIKTFFASKGMAKAHSGPGIAADQSLSLSNIGQQYYDYTHTHSNGSEPQTPQLEMPYAYDTQSYAIEIPRIFDVESLSDVAEPSYSRPCSSPEFVSSTDGSYNNALLGTGTDSGFLLDAAQQALQPENKGHSGPGIAAADQISSLSNIGQQYYDYTHTNSNDSEPQTSYSEMPYAFETQYYANEFPRSFDVESPAPSDVAQPYSRPRSLSPEFVSSTDGGYVCSSTLLGTGPDSESLLDATHQAFQPKNKVVKLMKRLSTLFKDKENYRQLLQCKGIPAQRLLDLFQRVLDIATDIEHSFQRHLIVATQRLAAKSGLYPASYELTDVEIRDLSECCGGFSDIYKGNFRGRAVCIKTIRLHRNSDMGHFLKVISREAVLWSQLRHPNLLPFYGIYRHNGRISFVSPWIENGDINEYLKRNTDSNRAVLAYDVAEGMEFLHKNGIIHGDLKGPNVLVDDSGRALLADFGLSSISDREILAWTSFSSAASKGGTVRWQAPELFDPEEEDEVHNTEASDIYAWACVAYEIFAGQVPFAHLLREAAVINGVRKGARPTRPVEDSLSWTNWGLTKDIWSLMHRCWDSEPAKRPSVQEIKSHLVSALPTELQTTPTSNILLSPGEFREMMRRNPEDIEMSVVNLEDILSSAHCDAFEFEEH